MLILFDREFSKSKCYHGTESVYARDPFTAPGETVHTVSVCVRAARLLCASDLKTKTKTKNNILYESNSIQFKMVSMRSEKPICAPPRLSEVSPTLPLKRFQCSSE